ncbi:hypothetical protein [Microbulbifer variabilis]|uniref:hypothetical protein n=1 Tax=Microbulbifer variabilis TaxID=266805 RepID=UPI00035F9AD9|nr:hypothetical protein [Microbulbifer variabilis]
MSKFSLLVSLDGTLTSGFKSAVTQGQTMLQRFSKSINETDEAMAAAEGLKKQRDGLSKLERRYEASSIKGERARQVVERKRKELWRAATAAQKYGISVANVDRKLERLERRSAGLKSLGRLPGIAKKSISHLKGIGAGATTAALGLFNFVKSTADSGNQAIDTANKLGFTVEGLQQYRFAAERSGITAKTFDMSAQNMIKGITAAAKGDVKASSALKDLGLDAQNLAQMKPEEQLKVIADAMVTIESQSKRISIADKLFGSQGIDMVNMLGGGSSGLEQMHQEANATGNVLDRKQLQLAADFNTSWLKLTTTLTGFKNLLATELMPTLMSMFKDFTQWLQKPEAKEFIRNFALGLIEVVKGVGSLVSKFSEFGGIAKSIGAVLTGIMTVAILPFISLLSLPGIIIAGIVAAVALLWVHWDKVVAAVGKFGDWLKEIRDKTLGSLWDKLPEGARKSLTKIKDFAFKILGKSPLGLLFRGASWLSGKLFGKEENPENQPTTIDTQADIRPRGGSNIMVQNSINSPINIYPSAGVDEESIGRKVGEELDKRQRSQEAQQRSVMFDLGIMNGAAT